VANPGKERTREERAAAGEILLARDQTLARMRAAARAAASDAAEKADRKDWERAAVAAALLLIGRKLGASLGAAVIRGRAEARMAARRRLRAEFGLLGAAAALPATSRARETRDATAAAKVAGSIATQWKALALLALRDAAKAEKDPGAALRATERAIAPSLDRAAATETARAYNGEHRAAALDFARANPEAASKMLREWSAMLEACERCWPHDGERVGLDEGFFGGDEPGSVHVRCACTETIVSA